MFVIYDKYRKLQEIFFELVVFFVYYGEVSWYLNLNL